MLELAVIALLLGIKHSYDTDHLVAVSNYVVKSDSVKNTLELSTYWAIGHMITAGIITIILYTFRETILKTYLNYFDFAVAIMLVAIGAYAFKNTAFLHRHVHRHGNIVHSHTHAHAENSRPHKHMHLFGIGVVHGLASNDELLLLFTLSLGLTSLAGILAGVAIFSLGVVIGMGIFGMLLVTPLLKAKSEKIQEYVGFFAGASSLVYGLYLLINLI